MKRAYPIAIVLLFIIIGQTNAQKQVPNFELKSIDNNYVNLNDLKGEKLTLIDFWATWCRPCVNSIPELIKIQHEFKEQGIVLIGISIDSPRNLSKVKPFASSLGIDYPILLDTDNELSSEINITAIPALILMDSENNILFRHEGYKPGDEILIREKIITALKQ